jgi:hypothetical protein
VPSIRDDRGLAPVARHLLAARGARFARRAESPQPGRLRHRDLRSGPVPSGQQASGAAYEDESFAREAKESESPTFVAHVRYASTGAVTLENTHPFEQHGRVFAHNGYVGDLATLESRLGEHRKLVQGDTDSERLFALITARSRRETATSAKESWRRFGGWPSRCRSTQ